MVEKHWFFKKPRRESQRNELQRFKKVEDSAISFKLNIKKEFRITFPETNTSQRSHPKRKGSSSTIPIPSMYCIFTYIHHRNQPNVGKYTIPMVPMGLVGGPFQDFLMISPTPKKTTIWTNQKKSPTSIKIPFLGVLTIQGEISWDHHPWRIHGTDICIYIYNLHGFTIKIGQIWGKYISPMGSYGAQ